MGGGGDDVHSPGLIDYVAISPVRIIAYYVEEGGGVMLCTHLDWL